MWLDKSMSDRTTGTLALAAIALTIALAWLVACATNPYYEIDLSGRVESQPPEAANTGE